MMMRTMLFLFIAGLISCSSPKMLEYRDYSNFRINKAGFNVSSVNLDLQYYNPNNFGMQLRRLDLDIYIDGSLLGHSALDTLIQIPRKNTFTLPLTVEVDMHNMLKNAWATLVNKEVTVKATGTMKVGKANVFMSMPVNYEGKQTVSW